MDLGRPEDQCLPGDQQECGDHSKLVGHLYFLLLACLKYIPKVPASMQQILRLLQLNLFMRSNLLALLSGDPPDPIPISAKHPLAFTRDYGTAVLANHLAENGHKHDYVFIGLFLSPHGNEFPQKKRVKPAQKRTENKKISRWKYIHSVRRARTACR
jgi:hypothetical protein